MNEQEQFLSGLEEDGSSVLDQPLDPTTTEEAVATEEMSQEDVLAFRRRREKRLEEKLQAERESNIAMAAKLEVITDSQAVRKEPGQYLSAVERIYGTESPEAREATEILKAALQQVEESAVEKAYARYQEQTQAETQAVQAAEVELDNFLEDIEDEFNVDLTSKEAEAQRKGYFKLLERMSPKDRDGNITSYADHIAVWEEYQERTKKKPDNTARNLASRSMTQSGSSSDSNVMNDALTRQLMENGII